MPARRTRRTDVAVSTSTEVAVSTSTEVAVSTSTEVAVSTSTEVDTAREDTRERYILAETPAQLDLLSSDAWIPVGRAADFLGITASSLRVAIWRGHLTARGEGPRRRIVQINDLRHYRRYHLGRNGRMPAEGGCPVCLGRGRRRAEEQQ